MKFKIKKNERRWNNDWASVSGSYSRDYSYSWHGRGEKIFTSDFTLCSRAVALWFEIPKSVKEATLVCSKREIAHSYKMKVMLSSNGSGQVKVYDPQAEKWRGHHIYHSTYKFFSRKFGTKVFYTRLEIQS